MIWALLPHHAPYSHSFALELVPISSLSTDTFIVLSLPPSSPLFDLAKFVRLHLDAKKNIHLQEIIWFLRIANQLMIIGIIVRVTIIEKNCIDAELVASIYRWYFFDDGFDNRSVYFFESNKRKLWILNCETGEGNNYKMARTLVYNYKWASLFPFHDCCMLVQRKRFMPGSINLKSVSLFFRWSRMSFNYRKAGNGHGKTRWLNR